MKILWIITDQQRYDAAGYLGGVPKAPNLVKLAEESTSFSLCYAQSPTCHPSRVSMFTGQYPSAHGCWTNKDKFSNWNKLIFQSIDTEIVYFGKVHLIGDTEDLDDRDHLLELGFNAWYTWKDWQDSCRAKERKGIKTPWSEYGEIMKNHRWHGKYSTNEFHHDDVITDKAIGYIKNSDDYFVVLSYYGPHPPYACPEPYCDMYNEFDDVKSQYYGSVTWLDHNIGRVLEVIDDDAIVIFTSDHGDILGDHGLFSKGLYGYEGNTRVPLLIRSDKLLKRKYNKIVQHIDIMPTLLELLDIEIPEHVQGKSLVSAVQTGAVVNRFALSMMGNQRMIIFRNERYKYWTVGGDERAFDLKVDPGENNPILDMGDLRKDVISALQSTLF